MTYSITLKTSEGEQTIQCEDDSYILDAADEAGIDLPILAVLVHVHPVLVKLSQVQ